MRLSLTAVASARAAQIQKYLPPTSGGHITAHRLVTSFNDPKTNPGAVLQHKPLPTTEKRRAPGRRPGNNIAFNDECCNYSSSSLWVELRSVVWYTLVSGPAALPLTRRYAPTAASPCRVNSDRVQRRLRCFSRVWLCSYHVKFPGVAEIFYEHP
jgi:hypothetical protein